MKVKVLSFTLGLAALASASTPGIAGGDWSDTGISNYNASVPVPAPIPVPVNAAQWYLRGDLGWAAGASGDVTSLGIPVTTYDFENGNSSFNVGFAIGYYLTRQWRLELAGDWTSESTVGRHTEGDTAFVTDATAPTYLGTLTGGGAVVCPVFFNGTAWVSN